MAAPSRSLAFLLPNLFTAASIFAGVYSMIAATQGRFGFAAWMILLSLIFDGLDGRVARLTNTCSRFGAEFDSLADIIAFGAAPAMLIYLYAGHEYGRFGVLVSALFVIFGAIRLARFNVMTAQTEPSVFIGVPIPTAATFSAVLVLLFTKYGGHAAYGWIILAGALVTALLMVSNIRYPSFKKIDMHAMHVKRVLVALLVAASLIFLFPIEGVALMFTIYILYGPLRATWFFYQRYTLLRKYRHRHKK
ncbi:CDP-diacylglycerol--serine O-phosphatidyltransferase [Sulfurimonas sp. HSL-3221]|uniref:CDP-diacylglycerol--serine O-phosphatidyltransferase n=1 Tax=Sulfurimonadaceae TaxID=2771471 RepID=UPI001E6012A0|nr:CDP-diacylglycerol--serine O-phosphatidyltransferase [Sulfurimonas sp. HSL-3221]UFS62027.1 CDP-diacylglycerol--serine O-phosphatidyltransferase [Sulfurimonas sp. HSL-3221]